MQSGVRRAVWSEGEPGSVGKLFFSICVFGFVFISLKDVIHFRERIEIPETGGTAAIFSHPIVKNYISCFLITPILFLIHKKIIFLS